MAGVKQYYGQSSSSLNERGSCSFDVTDPEALLRSWGSQRLWQLLPRSGGAELLHLQSERHISFMPIMMPHTVGAPASQGLCQLPPGGPPRHLGPQRGQAPPRTFGATARTVSAPAWRAWAWQGPWPCQRSDPMIGCMRKEVSIRWVNGPGHWKFDGRTSPWANASDCRLAHALIGGPA